MDPSDRTRLKLTVHYDGSAFHGWQLQPDHRTVQGELQAVLTRLAGSPRVVVGAGRTDAGVHATGQVASVDMPPKWEAGRLRRALNALLPDDVWIERVEPAPPRFHPRYDAVRRSYRYRVGTCDRARSPFHRRWCWALGEELDRDRLEAAAATLPGEHSFRSFAKAGQPERGDRCRIDAARWTEWELGLAFEVTADRYLHHMVRYLVGTMVEIARARRHPEDFPALLAGTPGFETSPPAPPEGLFLTLVEYGEGSRRVDPRNTRSEAPA